MFLKKNQSIKVFILIFISSFILIALYSKININQLSFAITKSNKIFIFLGILMNIILGILSGIKYSIFSKYLNINPFPGIKTSIKSYFIAGSFNIILPSKLADFGRAYICSRIDDRNYDRQLYIFSLYEKLNDLYSLLIITIFSFFLLKNFDNSDKITINFSPILDNNKILLTVIALSIILFIIIFPKNFSAPFNNSANPIVNSIRELFVFSSIFKFKKFLIYQFASGVFWTANILQIIIFAKAINVDLLSIGGTLVITLTILSGLLPISFAGIGAREFALTFLISSFYGNIKPLLLGSLMTTRYIVPAIIGIFYLKDFSLLKKKPIKN